MPVYEGVLHKISEGTVLPTGPTGFRVSEGPFGNLKVQSTGSVRQGGYTRREFVQVGDARITQVMLMPYHDALLVEALGKPVALSIDQKGQRNTVIAMRTPDAGLVRPELGRLIVSAVAMTLMMWVAALFGGLILMIVLGMILGTAGFVIGAMLALAFASRPLVYVRRTFRARAALDEVVLPELAVPATS